MSDRRFLEILIPPGINDERSRAILGAFKAMAAEFDFSDLLMRKAHEMPTEALPLAVYERSLKEFIAPGGSPEFAVRNLIDKAFVLHEVQGTDEGVKNGLAAFGVNGDVKQWHNFSPAKKPHTHYITIDISKDIFDKPEFFSEESNQQIWRVIDATKRWSQKSFVEFALAAKSPLYHGAYLSSEIDILIEETPPPVPLPEAIMRAGVSLMAEINMTIPAH